MSIKKFTQFINEAKQVPKGDQFKDFAEKREMGAEKIADNAKKRGGLAMLTYNHFIVKLPYYKKAAAGKITYEQICTEYDSLVNELTAGGFNQTAFQKLVGKIEVLGELKLEYEKLNPSEVKALNEGISEEDLYVYEVRCRDGEGTLKEILECIKDCGNTGHSFNVVVDPDEKEGLSERKFNWDGDGSDYIESIELTQSPEKVDEARLRPEELDSLRAIGLLDPDLFEPEEKDIQRAIDLQNKPYSKRDGAAESMAKLITDHQKLVRRAKAIAMHAPRYFEPFERQLRWAGYSAEQINRVRNYTRN
jgi:hypothetical protein